VAGAETVREHRRLYQKAGVAGVLELKCEGSEPALNEEQLAELGQELDRRLYLTAKEVADFVRHAMAKLLNRIGFVYKMPKCVPAKADPAAQQRFVEDTLAPLMAAANADNPLYFVDATHPSYTAHPARVGSAKARRGNRRAITAGERQHQWRAELAGPRGRAPQGGQGYKRRDDQAV
jgi:transposase